MKNLFNLATKELSQDAFLRWLIENSACKKDEQVREAGQTLLKTFLDLPDGEIVDEAKTYAQVVHTDICAEIQTSQGKKYIVVIEDKTDSCLHNDLNKYENKIVQRFKENYQYKYVYYKTGYIFKEDYNKLDSQEIKHRWKKYGLEEICNLFEKFIANLPNIKNNILHDYLEHLQSLKNSINLPVANWYNQTYCRFLEPFFFQTTKEAPILPISEQGSFVGIYPLGSYPLLWMEYNTSAFDKLEKLYGEWSSGKGYKLSIALEFQFRKYVDRTIMKTMIKVCGIKQLDNNTSQKVYLPADSALVQKIKSIPVTLFKWKPKQRTFYRIEEDVSSLTKAELEELMHRYFEEANRILNEANK